jgi:hypothetical protein
MVAIPARVRHGPSGICAAQAGCLTRPILRSHLRVPVTVADQEQQATQTTARTKVCLPVIPANVCSAQTSAAALTVRRGLFVPHRAPPNQWGRLTFHAL